MFYTQITPKNLNSSHLQKLAKEAKTPAKMMMEANRKYSATLNYTNYTKNQA
jgi:hypothetical protein